MDNFKKLFNEKHEDLIDVFIKSKINENKVIANDIFEHLEEENIIDSLSSEDDIQKIKKEIEAKLEPLKNDKEKLEKKLIKRIEEIEKDKTEEMKKMQDKDNPRVIDESEKEEDPNLDDLKKIEKLKSLIEDSSEFNPSHFPFLSEKERKDVKRLDKINKGIRILGDSKSIEAIKDAYDKLKSARKDPEKCSITHLEDVKINFESEITEKWKELLRIKRDEYFNRKEYNELDKEIEELREETFKASLDDRSANADVDVIDLSELDEEIANCQNKPLLIKQWLLELKKGFRDRNSRKAHIATIAYGMKITIRCVSGGEEIFREGNEGRIVKLEKSDLEIDTPLISLVSSELDDNLPKSFMINQIYKAYKSNNESVLSMLQRFENEVLDE